MLLTLFKGCVSSMRRLEGGVCGEHGLNRNCFWSIFLSMLLSTFTSTGRILTHLSGVLEESDGLEPGVKVILVSMGKLKLNLASFLINLVCPLSTLDTCSLLRLRFILRVAEGAGLLGLRFILRVVEETGLVFFSSFTVTCVEHEEISFPSIFI